MLPEFVTLQEAAQELGISTRQVSRLVSRLASDDVRRSPGRPTTCRLEALRVLRHVVGHDARHKSNVVGHDAPKKAFTEVRREAPTQDTLQSVVGHDARHDVGHKSNVVGHAAELIAELRADRDAWKAHAEKALQLVDQAQQLQLVSEGKAREAEGKLSELEAEVERLRALPAMPAETAPASQNGPQGGDTVPESPVEPSTAGEAQDGQKRGLWARLMDSFAGRES